MEKANKKILAIALSLSLITAVLIYAYMSGSSNTIAPATEIEFSTVYVAVKTIPARTIITGEDIKQIKIPKEILNASVVTDINDITGKHTIDSIIEGEQIIKERLADENSMFLSFSIPKETRAVSIYVSEQIDVANLLRPGDFVDVVASFEKEEEDNGQIVKIYPRITKTILQNVQVLALGQDLTLPADKLKELPTTVTLAIRKEDVEKFVYASEYGVLRLALRPSDDKSYNSLPGIVRGDITGTKGVYSTPSKTAN